MSETDNIRVGGSRRLCNGTNQGSVLGISGGVISIILDLKMDFQARSDSHSDVIAGMGFSVIEVVCGFVGYVALRVGNRFYPLIGR